MHTVAIKQDGSLWAWGYNQRNRLGIGNNQVEESQITPTRIGSDNSWKIVAAGGEHTVAIKQDGSLWAWGDNDHGELGDVKVIGLNNPSIGRMGISNDWVEISAGGYHSVAIKQDGSLWSWGGNDRGQLGDGTQSDKFAPVQIGTDSNWSVISAGRWVHSSAIKQDGSLWAWGDNAFGQIGNGTKENQLTPVRIGLFEDSWLTVAGSAVNTVAIKENGTMWSWGKEDGWWILDTNQVKLTPNMVGTDNDWVNVSSGTGHSVALKKNGTLWTWGDNNSGQLGDGTTESKSSPIKIETNTP